MSSSEVDQITSETSSLARTIAQVISTWRVTNPTATRVPRNVRREINQAIKADNRLRELEHAQERVQFEQRLIAYRWRQARDRGVRSWDTQATWFDRQRTLAIEHEQLRTSIYAAQHLTATERGTASHALTQAHRNPYAPIKPVFRTRHGLEALKARARDSYTRVRTGRADRAEQRRTAYWRQLRQERAQHPERTVIGYIPIGQLFEPDLDQPIPFVPVPEQLRNIPNDGQRSQSQQAPQREQAQHTTTVATDQDSAYRVTVGTAEFLREHPELAKQREVTSLAAGYQWAAEHLADERQGWPAGTELVVEIKRDGHQSPVFTSRGQHGVVTDAINAQRSAQQNPLTELEQLRGELRAVQAENTRLRTENTELAQQLTDQTPTPDRSATGPRIGQPIFSGPVLPQPVMNGMDR